jgi:hypothetical protein
MRNKLIIAILVSLFTFTATGQKLIDSPYSRFNIGTLQPEGAFRSIGMGSVGTAIRDNSSVYITNPASFSSFDTLSFIFDFGVDYGRNFISSGETKFSSDDINFHHLIIGFPLSKHWGLAAGVIPLSSGYYKITETVTSADPSYDPNIGEYTTNHEGSGGISKIFVGSGIQIGNHFSVGANLSILSGQLQRNNSFVFYDSYNVFNNNSTEKLQLVGMSADYGVQYATSLKNNYFLNLGASLSSGNNYSSKYSQLSLKYTAYGVNDTVTYAADNSTKTFIPSTLRLGVSFGKKNKFTTGLDFVTTKWSKSKIPGSTGYAADTRELRIGAELIPDKFSNFSYLDRIEYRIGGHIGNNYLIINGEQLKEYGASIGLGLPLRSLQGNPFSKINVYFDYTKKTGSLSNDLHNEGYFTMGFSLNLYDFWFLKRKFE